MKFKFEIGDLIKLPNILCYLRIIMVPVFLYVYFTATEPKDYYMATFIVMLSGLTDFLDGQIARRCNMITDLGRIIDPVADKLMQLAMLVALTWNIKYMYILVIYLIIKEAVSAITAFIVMKKKNRRLNGAKWYGKVSTAVLYLVMLALIAFPHMEIILQSILIIICAAALTLSFVMYMRIYVIMIRDSKIGNDDQVLY
ncbi:MAG: CDP-alcohol phosphatidyltransferase family protein [Lachnospira sp.]|jgi:cardiolipin synthase|nr:CDP-alcohol phosphatidyltransferase family protein [Lachnospira sp.]